MQKNGEQQSNILPAWFKTTAGAQLMLQEQSALKTLIPNQFYPLGLQFGYHAQSAINRLNIEQRYCCDRVLSQHPKKPEVVALPEAIPFPERCIDIAIMQHTLDYCDDPRASLREISQALSPEGILVITGFHPYSLWGLRRKFSHQRTPYDARFIALNQLQDWLALLDFQTAGARMLNYQPPELNPNWQHKLAFLDKMGDRWWPTMGAVYVLVVRKRVTRGLIASNQKRAGRKWFPKLKPSQAKIAQS